MFVFFARHLSRFYSDKAGGHEVGGLLCHGSVFVGTELMCDHVSPSDEYFHFTGLIFAPAITFITVRFLNDAIMFYKWKKNLEV